ncbi:MAG: tetratricopeptide repeat protein, partial [Stigonema ocellatum SAG 48.90 = DSM 106950]|nr:tetratricopeptide repeat protein [Stigonema ocellatum SAG 48.90 = DSM 106950]
MILLSDMVGATPSAREFRIGQQSVTNQEDAKRAAQEAYQEGFKLYKQGTAESLRMAIAKLEKALELWRQLNDKANLALTLTGIGKVYDDLGEKQKALEYYNQALPLRRAVGDKSGEATTLYNIAYLERNRGNLEQSLQQIEAAIKIIEDLRIKIDNSNLRTSYFASVQGYYKFYIDLLMQLHKKHPSIGYNVKALNASEKSRARVLLELLTEARAN